MIWQFQVARIPPPTRFGRVQLISEGGDCGHQPLNKSHSSLFLASSDTSIFVVFTSMISVVAVRSISRILYGQSPKLEQSAFRGASV
jgi:hypothetical protein